ncbi:MAG: bifunctional diaminohydroxyphosphoribosylaminopyrimidine deaminase/5-amino-6-(5-phosphoribosylamino)uracil reductase RibD [Flavobacteriales bacterium]|nr:bifunctional diaminohydroxyphosphoribosylaminopyrimidine deaminase/5-amino-6-(5-phosphoribosylamino)uracil reductase RibD [Flavobacteriales bacterium]
MRRCFEIAKQGASSVAPNPMVGCVITHNDKIIGEGYHQRYGESHAEVMAINSIANPELLPEATLYVNLEPCAHHGKTPPCADLIIEKKLKKVVVSNLDPYVEVAGKGLQRIREAGIEIDFEVLEKEGRWLNRRFFTHHEENRPYIILKWAQTNDGFLDYHRQEDDGSEPLKISGDEMNRVVHRWRSEESSILVGKNTAALDNPSLTTRLWPGDDPLRLVIDPQLQLKDSLKMFQDGKPLWVFNALKEYCEGEVCYVRISDPENFPLEISRHLAQNTIQSVIIEGGSNTLNRFVSANLWDEARIITSPMRIGSGIPTPEVTGKIFSSEMIGNDLLQVYLNE